MNKTLWSRVEISLDGSWEAGLIALEQKAEECRRDTGVAAWDIIMGLHGELEELASSLVLNFGEQYSSATARFLYDGVTTIAEQMGENDRDYTGLDYRDDVHEFMDTIADEITQNALEDCDLSPWHDDDTELLVRNAATMGLKAASLLLESTGDEL